MGSVPCRNNLNLFFFYLTTVHSLKNVGQRQDWKVTPSPCPCRCVSLWCPIPFGGSLRTYSSLLPALLLGIKDRISVITPHCQCKLMFSYSQGCLQGNDELSSQVKTEEIKEEKKKLEKRKNYSNLIEYQLFVRNYAINLPYANPFIFTVCLHILLLELFFR